MQIVGYKNAESIKEGFDSGMIFPSAKYNMQKGSYIIAVANSTHTVVGNVIQYENDIPNYICKKVFTAARDIGNVKGSTYDGWGGKSILKFEIINKQFTLIQGGKVKKVNGDQEMIKEFVEKKLIEMWK